MKVTTDSLEFQTWFTGVIKIYTDYMNIQFPSNPKELFTVTQGKRYIRVMRDGSAHCFVDKENGDILKAATWRAPAKHARGNIFDADKGLKFIEPYGTAYLR